MLQSMRSNHYEMRDPHRQSGAGRALTQRHFGKCIGVEIANPADQRLDAGRHQTSGYERPALQGTAGLQFTIEKLVRSRNYFGR